jgi:hypothetical protein
MVGVHVVNARVLRSGRKRPPVSASVSPRSWRDWSNSTRMVVAAGLVAAVAVVAFLYV